MADHASAGPDAGATPDDLLTYPEAVELTRELRPPEGKAYNTIARWVRLGKITKYRNAAGDVRVSAQEIRDLLTFRERTK